MPTLADFQARFPELAGPLRDLFEVHAALDTDLDDLPAADPDPGGTPHAGSRRGWPAVEGYEVTAELGRRRGMGVCLPRPRHAAGR